MRENMLVNPDLYDTLVQYDSGVTQRNEEICRDAANRGLLTE
jgi:hypothetical protein